jgi:hypothetical protein
MKPPIASTYLTDTLTLSECHPTADHRGPYWLYDKTRGMNLAMGANTREDALVEAIVYYQKRLSQVEADYKSLDEKVQGFLCQFAPEREE